MNNLRFFLFIIFILTSIQTWAYSSEHSVYAYSLPAKVDGDSLYLRDFKGKKLLIVNIASHCGYTKQLASLERIANKYAKRLVVIGVPSNDFFQTPESDEGIKTFCQKNYGVSFPLSSIVHVKGEKSIPLFKFFSKKSLNGLGDFEVSWNFNKFLIDENGHLLAYFGSKVLPDENMLSSYLP